MSLLGEESTLRYVTKSLLPGRLREQAQEALIAFRIYSWFIVIVLIRMACRERRQLLLQLTNMFYTVPDKHILHKYRYTISAYSGQALNCIIFDGFRSESFFFGGDASLKVTDL